MPDPVSRTENLTVAGAQSARITMLPSRVNLSALRTTLDKTSRTRRGSRVHLRGEDDRGRVCESRILAQHRQEILARAHRHPDVAHDQVGLLGARPHAVRSTLEGAAGRLPARREPEPGRVLERPLLEEYAPARVMVNEAAEALYSLGPSARYLDHPQGAPTLHIIQMAPRSLRPTLRAALRKASAQRTTVAHRGIAFQRPDRKLRVDLCVRPLPELGEANGLLSVLFQDASAQAVRDASAMHTAAPEGIAQ